MVLINVGRPAPATWFTILTMISGLALRALSTDQLGMTNRQLVTRTDHHRDARRSRRGRIAAQDNKALQERCRMDIRGADGCSAIGRCVNQRPVIAVCSAIEATTAVKADPIDEHEGRFERVPAVADQNPTALAHAILDPLLNSLAGSAGGLTTTGAIRPLR